MIKILTVLLFSIVCTIVQAQPEVPSKMEFCGKVIDLTRMDRYERMDRELLAFTYMHSTSIQMIKKANRYFPLVEPILKEEGIPEEKKMHFDLEEVMGQVLITFEQKINCKKLNVDVDMPAHPVFTIANQDAVTQVIYNLLDNAVKFCPEGGTLGLKIREGGNKAYVSISNDGETIPPEELPLVFDRFHKLDKSRSQNRDGWGLGLYIVKTIVCSHGENISVTSRDGKTEFTFTLPLVN